MWPFKRRPTTRPADAPTRLYTALCILDRNRLTDLAGVEVYGLSGEESELLALSVVCASADRAGAEWIVESLLADRFPNAGVERVMMREATIAFANDEFRRWGKRSLAEGFARHVPSLVAFNDEPTEIDQAFDFAFDPD